MMLVDTSVWIDYFNGRMTPETDLLHLAIQSHQVYVGDLVLTEVLQGFRLDKEYDNAREALGSLPVLTLVGPENAILAARNYRLLRKKGITIRSTIDCLIATYCITNEVPLLHSDRDFSPFEQHLGLTILRP
ncbi:MAG: PIN domain nuclease [Candidatus Promineofilum sp.]|jgi:predicted nucleic acid-binding protein|nr:PIN domain nuclease [Promineifilum sp.]